VQGVVRGGTLSGPRAPCTRAMTFEQQLAIALAGANLALWC
jgi:trimethylamine:corrinoid methyltransferase-like protein